MEKTIKCLLKIAKYIYHGKGIIFHSGVELYQRLIEEVVECAEYVDNETSAEFLVVYIFDKCDIFEKE